MATDICTWGQADEDGDVWSSDCGHDFQLNDGTPKDNNFKFCPYCGESISERLYGESEER